MPRIDYPSVVPGDGSSPDGRTHGFLSAPDSASLPKPNTVATNPEDDTAALPNGNKYKLAIKEPGPMEPGVPAGQVGPAPAEFRELVTHSGDAPVRRYNFQGLPIVVENPAGSTRVWQDADGHTGATTMQADYGYIKGIPGTDGDALDCFVGPDQDSDQVFVVHQMDRGSGWVDHDEDKVILGCSSVEQAKALYLAHYDSPLFLGAITPLTMAQFKTAIEKLKAEPAMIRRRVWAASSSSLRAKPLMPVTLHLVDDDITLYGKPKASKSMPPVRHPTHDAISGQMLPCPIDPGQNVYQPPGVH